MRCICIFVLRASCEQGCKFVSTRVCILVVFLQMLPHTQCVWCLQQTHMGRVEVLYPSHHEYLHSRSHCVWRLTCTVPLCVVCLARTVLLTFMLFLSGLLLAQCTRSTLFISSHTSQRNVFLCLTPHSHRVFFIAVGVSLTLWRANFSEHSHNVVFFDHTVL